MSRPSLAIPIAALVLASSQAIADPGHSHSHADETAYGMPGDPKKPSRPVNVTMREAEDGKMQFILDRIEVRRGEQIRFVLRNVGKEDHEFLLATTKENLAHAEVMKKHPHMEHDDPNGVRLAPNKSAEIVWKFTKSGTFEFSCLIPDHRDYGMVGHVTVK